MGTAEATKPRKDSLTVADAHRGEDDDEEDEVPVKSDSEAIEDFQESDKSKSSSPEVKDSPADPVVSAPAPAEGSTSGKTEGVEETHDRKESKTTSKDSKSKEKSKEEAPLTRDKSSSIESID